jgi:hypothetical protein
MNSKKNIIYNSVPLSVDISVPNNADVIIGQSFYLYITVFFNGDLPSDFDIGLDAISGMKLYSITKAIPVDDPEIKNAMRAVAYINIDNSLKSGDEVSYKVNVPDIYISEIQYTANSISKKSIELSVDKYICELPESETNINDGNKNFITYTTILKNNNGHVLKNTPIQILSAIEDDLIRKVIITTNPNDGFPNPVRIYPKNYDNNVFIPINSDLSGKVSFRVYPVKDQPITLRLGSELPGLEIYYTAPYTYMLSPKPVDPNEYLSYPIISNLTNSELHATGSDYTFSVNIEPYTYSYNNDSIIFFIDDKPVLPIDIITYPNPDNYNFNLYYDIFPRNKEVSFRYVIAHISGNTQYSHSLPITYVGGGDNIPSKDIKRVFDMPMVYKSYANPYSSPPLNKDDDDYIIRCGSIMNSSFIKNYQENGGYGLFVKIIGTNDLTDDNKPKFGEKINLTMYINGDYSDIVSFNDVYKQVRKSYSCVISDEPDYPGGKTSTTVIGIKHNLVVNLADSPVYGMPMIYFEYYIDNDGMRKYSNYYYSQIETIGE